jgi:hypothetical protein
MKNLPAASGSINASYASTARGPRLFPHFLSSTFVTTSICERSVIRTAKPVKGFLNIAKP